MKPLTTNLLTATVLGFAILASGCARSQDPAPVARRIVLSERPTTRAQTFDQGNPGELPSSAASNPVRRPGDPPPSAAVDRFQTRDLANVEYSLPTPPPDQIPPATQAPARRPQVGTMGNYQPSSGTAAGGGAKTRRGGKAAATASASIIGTT